MATTVGQHQVSTITDPADGSAMVASTMRSATNAVRTGANDHDNDSGIHFQSSASGSRPAAGTAGRKWLDTDTLLVKYDNGVSWDDIAYLKSSGGTVTGAVTVSAGGIAVTGNSTITGTLGGLTGLTVASGGAAITGNSTVTGDLNVTGALSYGTMTAGTIAGVSKITSNATSFALRDNADSADIIKYTESNDTLVIGNTAAVDSMTIEADALSISASGVTGVTVNSNYNVAITAGSAGGDVLLGTQAPLTSATTGFPVIGSHAGTPSGAATNGALVVDSTNNRLYVRVGGTWKYASLT